MRPNRIGAIMVKWYNLITINGKRVSLSRWLMEQHLSRKLSDEEIIHHIDGNPQNNTIDNLQITSLTEHIKEGMAKRGMVDSRGSKHGASKLIEADVIEIRQRLERGEGIEELALEYGISYPQIGSIKHRRTWKHI